jgi:hypothetical protein
LSYVIDTKYVWQLDLSNPGWKFIPGASFNIGLQIGNQYLNQSAKAVAAETVRVSLQDSLTTFLALNWTWQIGVTAGAVHTIFPLAFGDRVLNDLVRCVNRNDSARLKKGVNASFGTAPWQGAGQSFDTEASVFNTRITSFVALAPEPLGDMADIAKQLKPNAVSRVGTFLVMTSVVPPGEATNPEGVAHVAIDRDIKACRGDIFAGLSLLKTPRGPAARGYSSCRMPDSGISMRYTVVPRAAGGYYFTSIVFSGPELVQTVEQNGSGLDLQAWAAISTILAH